jgi:ABC-type transport system involved in multi-copper enzyme maturation permease subunit
MLMPAFMGAMTLAVLPAWLLPMQNSGQFVGWLYLFGVMMLGVSSFGREIGLKTVPFMLAQPLDRSRVWWTKIAVLGISTALVFGAWCVSLALSPQELYLRDLGVNSSEGVAVLALVVTVLTSGGVWMTLLLRQMAAAFWLANLIPVVLSIAIKAIGGADWMVFAALGLYAVTAFFSARWQFLHLQDTGWSGGVLTLSRTKVVQETSLVRECVPWRALFRKELKLQEFTLAGIAALFVLHLGAIALRRSGGHAFGETTRLALEAFGMVWIVVPFVAGSQSVAEERQYGTLDGLLCLPVSRRAQFCIKLGFVLVLGGLVSASLLCGAEAIGSAMGAGTGNDVVGNIFEFAHVVVVFLALSLLGFYASTLTRSVAQSLAAGAVVGGAYFLIGSFARQPFGEDAFGVRLWPAAAGPMLAVTALWLSYGNFKWAFETGRRWRWNFLVLTAVVIVASASATVVYHRAWGAWEWFAPMEGVHGQAVLPSRKPVVLHTLWGNAIAAVLPDGRLWLDRVVDGRRPTVSGGYFAAGSNWADVALLAEESVAIRSDGTLWVSEKPGWQDHLVQFGTDTDWQSVEPYFGYSVILLKHDGTLWEWGPGTTPIHVNAFRRGAKTWSLGTNTFKSYPGKLWILGTNNFEGEYPGLRAFFTPLRIGSDSGWARMILGGRDIFAWKRNGDAWALSYQTNGQWGQVRDPVVDNIKVKSFNQWGPHLWVLEDGTLWWHRAMFAPASNVRNARAGLSVPGAGPELMQIGTDSDWAQIASGQRLLGLKTDGTVWKWKPFLDRVSVAVPLRQAPTRFGKHSDWIGVGFFEGQSAALSADGTLWRLPSADAPQERERADSDEWLAPSDRPSQIENILDSARQDHANEF